MVAALIQQKLSTFKMLLIASEKEHGYISFFHKKITPDIILDLLNQEIR